MSHQSTYVKESRSTRKISSTGFESNENKAQLQAITADLGPSRSDFGDPSEDTSALTWSDLYSIDWKPKECVLKFRQHVEDFQIGGNLEFQVKKSFVCNPKLVLKPISEDRMWKVVFEPKRGDLRLLSKKISVGPFLSLQVGLGHDFQKHATGWSWKLSSIYGGNGGSHVRYKTMVPLCPGFDVKVAWNAEYVLPDIHGGLGTGEPIIGLNYGHLYGSLERVEAIITSTA